MGQTAFKWKVTKITEGIKTLLLEKNKKYGDAALSPIHIFSDKTSTNSIAIRIDDKINRIKNGSDPTQNDVVDLLGYLILYLISKDWITFSDLN